jgi:hypothetical protein
LLIQRAKSVARIFKRVQCEKCGCNFRYERTVATQAFSFLPLILLAVFVVVLILYVFLRRFFFISVIPVGCGYIGIAPVFPLIRGVILEFTKDGGPGQAGKDHAGAIADRRMRRKILKTDDPVPCPDCGWYQRSMNREARRKALPPMHWVFFALLVLAQGISYLVFEEGGLPGHPGFFPCWEISMLGAGAIGFIILSVYWLSAQRIDLNKGFPAQRELCPNSPKAIREADWAAKMAAASAKVIASASSPGARRLKAGKPIATRVLPPPNPNA